MGDSENHDLFKKPEDESVESRGIVTAHLKQVLSTSFSMSAEEFFELLKRHGTTLLVDIRVSREYPYARFSHERDLAYLCEIHGVTYVHGTVFAPTPELRQQFSDEVGKPGDRPKLKDAWTNYLKGFQDLMKQRKPSQDPMVLEHIINGKHTAIAIACNCARHCDCHRSVVGGLLGRQLKDVKLIVDYPDAENPPPLKSPRRYLLEALPHAGLIPTPRRGGNHA